MSGEPPLSDPPRDAAPPGAGAPPVGTPPPERPVREIVPEDPWAHRRGEPRVFAFLWTMFLFGATAATFHVKLKSGQGLRVRDTTQVNRKIRELHGAA